MPWGWRRRYESAPKNSIRLLSVGESFGFIDEGAVTLYTVVSTDNSSITCTYISAEEKDNGSGTITFDFSEHGERSITHITSGG